MRKNINMDLNHRSLFILKLVLLTLLIVVPFSLSDYSDNIVPEKITSDLAFYEINTCKISLFEFLFQNQNVIYQDHYKIRFNNYSSIGCFGQITGIDQIGYNFYISIGTNTLLNIFLQSLIWTLILSIFPIKKIITKSKMLDYILMITVSLFFCLLFYSEKRYYENNIFFELDLQQRQSYIFLFFYILSICYVSQFIIESRSDKIINYLPFLYLFMGVISGVNLYFLFIYFSFIGLRKIITTKKIRSKFYLVFILIFFWSYKAVGENFYLKPDKIRGLSHADYNFMSVFVWSSLVIFTLFGVYYFVIEKYNNFNILSLKNNFVISGTLLLVLGYLGSSMPLFNFMNYYAFGQTKFGTDNSNLFSVNYWGENEAWRGFFPSAETVGEFYGISLLIIFLFTKKYDLFTFFGVGISLLGLFAANNKAALVALLFCIFLKVNSDNQLKIQTKIFLFSIPLFFLIYFIRFENFVYSFEFLSKKMIEMGVNYSSLGEMSTSIEYLQNISEKNYLVYILFSIFSILSFLINRSELWGLFFARYSPSFDELLFGTGPYILSNHYGEINISTVRYSTGTDLGFLLPHSSLLLLLVFFGLIGLICFLIYIFYLILNSKLVNYNFFILNIFIFINLIKSDSLLYFPSLLLYLTFFLYPIGIRYKSKNRFNA